MHWKVKALGAVIAINLLLLLVIGIALWFSRPGRERPSTPPPPAAELSPQRPVPAELPPLELPTGG
jgi:hypothetical protein